MSLSDEEKKLKQLKDEEEKRLLDLGEMREIGVRILVRRSDLNVSECEETRRKATKYLLALVKARALQL